MNTVGWNKDMHVEIYKKISRSQGTSIYIPSLIPLKIIDKMTKQTRNTEHAFVSCTVHLLTKAACIPSLKSLHIINWENYRSNE